MNRFRTRLIAAAAVTAMLFGGVMLLAMQSADSQPMSTRATDVATGPATCARSIDPDGYYQAEYAARLRCDHGPCRRPLTSREMPHWDGCRN
jgi:hypothetical protein